MTMAMTMAKTHINVDSLSCTNPRRASLYTLVTITLYEGFRQLRRGQRNEEEMQIFYTLVAFLMNKGNQTFNISY